MSHIGVSEPGLIGVDAAGDGTPGGAAAKRRGTRLLSRSGADSWSRVSTVGLPVLSSILVIGVWWLSTIMFGIRTFFLPAPPDVVKSFLELPDYLLQQTWVTVVDAVLGFGLAIVAGLLISVAISTSTILYRATMPLLVALNSVPKVALAPLLLLWMGFGQLPRVVMTLLISFFPIVVAATAGLTSTPGDLNELGRSLSASRWQQFIKVRFPWALPQIFIGLKVGISLALVGAVVAELSGSGKGLGFVVLSSGTSADTPLAFAAIGLLAIVSIGLFYLVVALERLLLPWAKEITA
jgi:NitT/TauT family transport system permease protein